MITRELIEYVSAAKKLGHTQDSIRASLSAVGWREEDISVTLSNIFGEFAQGNVFPLTYTPAETKKEGKDIENPPDVSAPSFNTSIIFADSQPAIARQAGKKKFLIIAAILSVLAAIAGGILFVAYVFWPLSPEKIFKEAAEKSIRAAAHASFEGTFEISRLSAKISVPNINGREPFFVSADADNITGVFQKDARGSKFDISADIALKKDGADLENGKLFLKTIGDVFYVKIVPSQSLSLAFPEFAPYFNTWVSVKKKDFSVFLIKSGVFAPNSFELSEKENTGKLKKSEDFPVFSDLFFVSKKLADETRKDDGSETEMYHYEISLNNSAVQEFASSVPPEFFKETFFEVWINKKEYSVAGVRARGSFELGAPAGSGKKTHFSLTGNFADPGKPTKSIIAPVSAMPIEVVLKEIFGEKPQNIAIKEYMSVISSEAKKFFDGRAGNYGPMLYENKAGRCPKNGGTSLFYANKNIRSALSYVLKNNGDQKLLCATGRLSGNSARKKSGGAQSYAVSSPLFGKEAVSYCVDSSGFAANGIAVVEESIAFCKRNQ